MLRTIREGIRNRRSNRPAEIARPLKVPKDPSEAFLLVASHFVTDKPVGYDDIMANFEYFHGLEGNLRALIRAGVIKTSEADPEKFEFTRDGYQWAKDTLKSLTLSTEVWTRAERHFAPRSPQRPQDPQVISPRTIESPTGSNVLRFPDRDL